jgi:hypothetical protein
MTAPDRAPAAIDRTYDGADDARGSDVKSQIREVKNQVVDHAKTTLTQARDSAASSLTDSKGRLAEQVTHVANAFRTTTDHLRQNDQPQLAGYADGVARQAERLAGYLRTADFRAMGDDVRDLARRQPALVVGGAFALGLLAARFLKSSDRKTRAETRGEFHRAGIPEQSFTDTGFDAYSGQADAFSGASGGRDAGR